MGGFAWIRSKKRLGQVFLVNEGVAVAEAAHSEGKVVIEIGPGTGILTRLLCSSAKKVIAVEKDRYLFAILKHEIRAKNLVLINKDFFDATDSELELGSADIVISNIPYNLSSRVIEWLAEKRMQAVLCLQKEFVDHMLASPGTRDYSKLSVAAALFFRTTAIMKVPKGNFRPMPKVDSVVVYLKPVGSRIDARDMELVGLIMQHKKKTVRNAVIDSSSQLGRGKAEIAALADRMRKAGHRVFKLKPEEILDAARELRSLLG